MIISTTIRNRYLDVIGVVESAAVEIEDIIRPYCKERGYLFESRVKTLESVAEKIESGRFRIWSDLEDIYACTIVIPLATDEESVIGFLESQFRKRRLTTKGQINKQPDVFRFDSTRFIGILNIPTDVHDEGNKAVFDICFEIQIKTFFEYAWDKTTHALSYKSSELDWTRLRLAAQLKAAVEQIDMLILGFSFAETFISEGYWPPLEDKRKIREFFVSKAENGTIPRELVPKDWSRFADNVYRVFQALEGIRPMSQPTKSMKITDSALAAIDDYIANWRHAKPSHNLSLFQIVLGVLASRFSFKNTEDYYLPISEEIESLFPETIKLKRRFEL